VSADRLHVVQVNTQDVGGGAEAIARGLHEAVRRRGHPSHFAVGRRYGDDRDTLQIPNGDELKSRQRIAAWLAGRYPPPDPAFSVTDVSVAVARLSHLARWLSWPLREGARRTCRGLAKLRGHEDFHFPGTRRLTHLAGKTPDVLHLHNLHGGYFDLRVLPSLTQSMPVLLTLHDAWTFSGHCAHSMDCDRWLSGCGSCPDLAIYPPVKRDATNFNWLRKQAIFRRCRLHLATPSKWLMERARRSILWPGVVESRVIPNGVDQTVFRPGDGYQARWRLGLPSEADILLFAANGIRQSSFKDFTTLRSALARLGGEPRERPLILLAVGERGASQRVGSAELRFVPPVRSAALMAEHYRAADLYLHAAKADTFPTTVIESLSCGTPVVATAVGGIPEQVTSLAVLPLAQCQQLAAAGVRFAASQTATGVLTPPGDAEALSEVTGRLLEDADLRARISGNAAREARRRFSQELHHDAYFAWYRELAGQTSVDRRAA
jgi:glycosyltransferase involved in cell wall biosynthesis